MHVLKKIINKYFSLKSSNETEILQSSLKDSRLLDYFVYNKQNRSLFQDIAPYSPHRNNWTVSSHI